MVARNQAPYTRSEIPKRQGGTRQLDVPADELMNFQRWFLREFLDKLPVHPASFAYSQGRSVEQCARAHLGARWILKMDLESFFTSIDERSVYYLVLKELSASKQLSFQLARLLTCPPLEGDTALAKYDRPYKSFRQRDSVPGHRPEVLGRLPQGSPTSGSIANFITGGLDKGLTKLAFDEGLTYTRYADDLFFSSYRKRDRLEAARPVTGVTNLVIRSGFAVNPRKTTISVPGRPIKVLGLHVDGPALRLPKEFRLKIDRHLRGIRTFGLADHARHVGHQDPAFLLSELEGLLGFANDVAKGWARPRRDEFRSILSVYGASRRPL